MVARVKIVKACPARLAPACWLSQGTYARRFSLQAIGTDCSRGNTSCLVLLLLPALSCGPALRRRPPGLRVPLSQLRKNGPHGLRNVLMQ